MTERKKNRVYNIQINRGELKKNSSINPKAWKERENKHGKCEIIRQYSSMVDMFRINTNMS